MDDEAVFAFWVKCGSLGLRSVRLAERLTLQNSETWHRGGRRRPRLEDAGPRTFQRYSPLSELVKELC
jgi:hypothetical protein